jgi:hypothetical protein
MIRHRFLAPLLVAISIVVSGYNSASASATTTDMSCRQDR